MCRWALSASDAHRNEKLSRSPFPRVDAWDQGARAAKVPSSVGRIHRRANGSGDHQAAVLPIGSRQSVGCLLCSLLA
jgi:hypothetical protein